MNYNTHFLIRNHREVFLIQKYAFGLHWNLIRVYRLQLKNRSTSSKYVSYTYADVLSELKMALSATTDIEFTRNRSVPRVICATARSMP